MNKPFKILFALSRLSLAAVCTQLPVHASGDSGADLGTTATAPQVELLTQVVADQHGPEIFPPAWIGGRINISALPLDAGQKDRVPALMTKALSLYPVEMLNQELEQVYVVGGLTFKDVRAGGTYARQKVYSVLARNYSDQSFLRIFHAEFSSVLFHKYRGQFPEGDWTALKPADFEYRKGGSKALAAGQVGRHYDEELLAEGFLHEYAKASIEEDFNSYAARLLIADPKLWEAIKTHERVKQKAHLAMDFYHSINPAFTREFFESLREG